MYTQCNDISSLRLTFLLIFIIAFELLHVLRKEPIIFGLGMRFWIHFSFQVYNYIENNWWKHICTYSYIYTARHDKNICDRFLSNTKHTFFLNKIKTHIPCFSFGSLKVLKNNALRNYLRIRLEGAYFIDNVSDKCWCIVKHAGISMVETRKTILHIIIIQMQIKRSYKVIYYYIYFIYFFRFSDCYNSVLWKQFLTLYIYTYYYIVILFISIIIIILYNT